MIIFHEQVIRIAMALADFTPGEADLLLRVNACEGESDRGQACVGNGGEAGLRY